jgi:hypothetical protein
MKGVRVTGPDRPAMLGNALFGVAGLSYIWAPVVRVAVVRHVVQVSTVQRPLSLILCLRLSYFVKSYQKIDRSAIVTSSHPRLNVQTSCDYPSFQVPNCWVDGAKQNFSEAVNAVKQRDDISVWDMPKIALSTEISLEFGCQQIYHISQCRESNRSLDHKPAIGKRWKV